MEKPPSPEHSPTPEERPHDHLVALVADRTGDAFGLDPEEVFEHAHGLGQYVRGYQNPHSAGRRVAALVLTEMGMSRKEVAEYLDYRPNSMGGTIIAAESLVRAGPIRRRYLAIRFGK